MKFIIPKNKRGKKTTWIISEDSRNLVRYYAEYTEHSEDEVVDVILKNIREDHDFEAWVLNKRNNKRALAKVLGISDDEGDMSG